MGISRAGRDFQVPVGTVVWFPQGRLKRDLYERVGVQEYWLVDPERDVIEVYQRRDARFQGPAQYGKTDVLTTPLMPGLELPVGRILREPSEPSG